MKRGNIFLFVITGKEQQHYQEKRKSSVMLNSFGVIHGCIFWQDYLKSPKTLDS